MYKDLFNFFLIKKKLKNKYEFSTNKENYCD